jgi:hypothetical protein
MKVVDTVKAWPGKAKYKIDVFLSNKCHMEPRSIDLTWHFISGLWDQVLSIIPISVLQIAVLGIFYSQTIVDAGLQVMGLFLAIIGLTMFLEGLRIAIMPMAELIGQELPQKLHLVFVLFVAFILGILVTYAEPAISSLRPLADLIDPNDAPYLYFVMVYQQELLVLAIGLGVGVAAVIGTLRFIKNWSLKPLIYVTLAPTVGLACYMQWGNTNLAPLIGLSWDCGAVTTGPVTVPVLLALGIGVMQSSRKKRLAQAALEGSVAAGAGNALEGFGIVTLASLFPILAVELMSIIDGAMYDEEYVKNKNAETIGTQSSDAIDEPPLSGVVYGIRSIMPLVALLFIIILLVLRRPLPKCVVWVESKTPQDSSIAGGNESGLARASVAISKLERTESESSFEETEDKKESNGGSPKASTEVGEDMVEEVSTKDIPEVTVKSQFFLKRWWTASINGIKRAFSASISWLGTNAALLFGVALAQIGMISFNEGLAYAFTKLGKQTGLVLPSAFLEVNYNATEQGVPLVENSPLYSYAGGLILVLIVVFFIGVLATRAEPALNVLGRTVERLSGGSFTSRMLIGAVCVGVGIGMAVGSVKILYTLPVVYFILGKYAIAIALTIITGEAITAVAWDSAGVTTGPVTVPFVLSIGIGFSMAVGSSEGFGILTIMSVSPIISVLLTSLLRKPAKAAGRKMSNLNKTFKKLITFQMRRRLDITPSFAMANFADESPSASREPSIRGGSSFAPSGSEGNV